MKNTNRISIRRAFGLLSVPLGAGLPPESTRIRTFAKHGVAYRVAWAAACPVLFPIEVLGATMRAIQQESEGEPHDQE